MVLPLRTRGCVGALLVASAFACPIASAQPASLSLPAGGLAHIDVDPSAALAMQQFTAAAWIRPTGPGVSGGGTIMTCGQRTGPSQYACSWWLGWTTGTGQLSGMVVNSFGVAARVVTTTGSVPLNQWAHVALTFDGTTVRVYINGTLDAQAPYGFTGVDYPPAPAMKIGRFQDINATYNHFDGQIDDATLWNRALSPAELVSLTQCEPAADAPGLKLYLPFTSSSIADRSPSAFATVAVLSPGFDANAAGLGLHPLVTSGPDAASACPGGGAVFAIGGTAGTPFTYQWRRAESPIDSGVNPSAATPTLSLSGVTLLDAVNYDCVVTNPLGCGSITSRPARLFVDPADVGLPGGLPGRDGVHDNNDFIAFITYFFAQNPTADLGSAGGTLGPDGQFDNNDFIVFITQFFNGCT